MPVLQIMVIFTTMILGAYYCHGQQFSFSGSRMKQSISFSLLKNLVVIPVYIDGKGPFNFILDTGVGPMIITDPGLMDSLKFQNLRTVKIAGLGKGEPLDAYVSASITARVGDAEYPRIPTAILKEDLFNLSSYLGTPIHGLLGYHFFKSFVVEVRYVAKRLVFYRHGYERKIKGTKVPLEIIGDKPYAQLNIRMEGGDAIPLTVLLDNGASHALSLEKLDEKAFPQPEKTIPANLGVGLSGPIDGRMGRIAHLEFGGYHLNSVLGSFPAFDDQFTKILIKERNGNLGADVLSRFNTTYDYEHKTLYLKRNYNFKKPFEQDMSGLEVVAEGPDLDRFIVGRVDPESPADEAMLLSGDEIMSLNMVPATKFSLTELNSVLRDGKRKFLLLTISRDGKLSVKMLKLKQRI